MTLLSGMVWDAARSFLQSAVIVDDEAGQLIEYAAAEPTVVEAPTLGAARPRSSAESPPTSRPRHPLHSKLLVEAFAREGVVCGVFQPGDLPMGEDPVDAVLGPAVARADVVILDWQLSQDDGARAVAYIKQIIAGDPDRLRLIAIYTGESNLHEIARHIASEVDAEAPEESCFTVQRGATRIEVFGKKVALVDGAAKQRVFGEQELPMQLVSAFAKANSGVVPAATMLALAAVRRNAHRMLSALGPGLDVGFLGHRMLLPDPEDAGDHLLRLIGSEIESIIMDDRQARQMAGRDGACAWNMAISEDHRKQLPDALLLERSLTEGFKAAKQNDNGALSSYKPRSVTNALTVDQNAGLRSARDFAIRMTTKTAYENPRAQLTLGCVLRDDKDGYWLCVQPACDSVRLDGPRSFPFLPYTRVEGDSFDAMVRCGDEVISLTIAASPHHLRMVAFAPDDIARCVLEVDGRFSSVGDGGFALVAQLKPSLMQQAAHNMGHAFSRPGVDLPEFLRIRVPKG